MQRYDRFRHLCLKDLASPAALMRMHDDHPYADDWMGRIADSRVNSTARMSEVAGSMAK